MSSELLYLSNADIEGLKISPREAREAVLVGFRDIAAGSNISLPKSSIDIRPGHVFQSMSAASAASGIATIKWVAVAPSEGSKASWDINTLVCVSDYKTGVPIAVIEGNPLTLTRTAAMSAAAAVYLAPEAPTSIGFIGCGSQAHSHLDAFVDLFPSLRTTYLFSRTLASAEKLASAASEKRLATIIANDPDALLRHSEVVVSTVPSLPGLKPFLDARSLPASSFASSVDAGWTWRPETLSAFDKLVTDSLKQTTSPLDVSGHPVESVRFQDDLVHLASGSTRPNGPIRALFSFRGFAIADLAVAELAIGKARALKIGTSLPR